MELIKSWHHFLPSCRIILLIWPGVQNSGYVSLCEDTDLALHSHLMRSAHHVFHPCHRKSGLQQEFVAFRKSAAHARGFATSGLHQRRVAQGNPERGSAMKSGYLQVLHKISRMAKCLCPRDQSIHHAHQVACLRRHSKHQTGWLASSASGFHHC